MMKEHNHWSPFQIQYPIERMRIVPEYVNLAQELERLYDQGPERIEYSKAECRGAHNFALTLGLVIDQTLDGEAARCAYEALKNIAKLSNAGSLSWETRRFVRSAPLDHISEFFRLVKECIERNGRLSLDLDDFWAMGGDKFYAEEEMNKLRYKLRN